jgi:hypothetical protein
LFHLAAKQRLIFEQRSASDVGSEFRWRKIAMKIFAALALVFAISQGGFTPVQAQSAPVQPGQTPQQSEQSREQDRSRAEDVKIKRDWKAQGGDKDHAGPSATDRDHETVGRDWRAHPDNRDR